MASTIALVTGANQGIGLEIAKKLAAEHKYHVIITGRRKNAIEEVAKSLQDQGLSVEPLVMELTSDESIAAAAKYVGEKHGHIDVLVNNAAIAQAPATSANGKAFSPREELLLILDTNVAGPGAVTDAFIPLLQKSKQTKRIVFLGSRLGSLTNKADVDHPQRKIPAKEYTISKTAGHMLALFYAAQFDGQNDWKVNITCPGYCATNLNDNAGTDSPELGAVNAVRLATLGPDGPTNTFTSREGPCLW